MTARPSWIKSQRKGLTLGFGRAMMSSVETEDATDAAGDGQRFAGGRCGR